MEEKKKPGPKPGTRPAGKPKGWQKYDEPMVQVLVRLPQSLADEVKALPGTMTDNIRRALEEYLALEKSKNS